jgi:ABC-type transport system involved in cytochrome c biogenesis permease component
MTLWPVAGRELQVAARRRMTYRVRLMAAAGGVAVLGLFVWQGQRFGGPGFAPGGQSFMALAALSMVYCFFEGLRTTSDCLSEEKREGTLGLLFLTDLSGWDVVLGKLAATSINSFYGLLAIFPVLAVALSMGGVLGAEFWRMVLVLADSLTFSLALGIWCSARSRDAYKAAVAAFTGLAMVAAVPFLLDRSCSLLRRGLGDACFALASPVYTAQMAYESGYLASPVRFWGSLAVVHLLTWALLWNAGRYVARHCQEDAKSSGLGTWWRHTRAGSTPVRSKRDSVRTRWLDLNPGIWLAKHFQGSDWLLWVPAILAVAGIAYESRFLQMGSPGGASNPANAARIVWAPMLAALTSLLFCLIQA